MVSKVNNLGVFNNYQNDNKDTKKTESKAGDTNKTTALSKADALKQSISSGSYKIDIKALAAKVADSLL